MYTLMPFTSRTHALKSENKYSTRERLKIYLLSLKQKVAHSWVGLFRFLT